MLGYIVDHANWESGVVMVGRTPVQVEPGQLIIGRKRLSIALGIPEWRIRKGIAVLKSASIIAIKPASKWSVATICDYETYRPSRSAISQQMASKPATEKEERRNCGREGWEMCLFC